MNYFPPKIEFYRQRNFSEKLNVTFQFIRENWKPLAKFTIYLLLPVCLIQALVMNSLVNVIILLSRDAQGYDNFADFNYAGLFTNYGIMLLCIMTGTILLSAMVYALMQTYEKRECHLAGLQWSDFKESLITNIKNCLRLLLMTFIALVLFFFILGFVVSGILASIHPGLAPVVFLVALAAACICLIPLSLTFPIYIFEPETSLKNAIFKAWKFGFSDFWSLLGFLIVISIISSVFQTITTMPWYITTVVGTLFSLQSDPAITQSIFYKFSVYLLGIIQSMGNYVASIIMMTGLAFQYFHSREKNEGVTIESNITNFNELQ